jgi:drug/metabolite transporter (DMT)-like permease
MQQRASLETFLRDHRPVVLRLALFAIGLAWGLTAPFSKLAVSTGNHPVGVAFWTTIIATALLTGILRVKGKRLPLRPRNLFFFLTCGLLGTALPHSLSYVAYGRLPVGVTIIVISLVPMATLLLVLLLRLERPDSRRLLGLGLGIAAVLLMVLPETSLPEPDQAAWLTLPLIVSLAYAAENVYVATARPPGSDALTILCGLNWGALLLLTPAVLMPGVWFNLLPLDPPEQAVIANAVLHTAAYLGFIWLIGHAGPVFASQVGYLVTGAGVFLGIAVYGERHSLWVWAALALMLAGLALVKPRR